MKPEVDRELPYYIARAFVAWGLRWLVYFAIIWLITRMMGGPYWLWNIALIVAGMHLVGLLAWRITRYIQSRPKEP